MTVTVGSHAMLPARTASATPQPRRSSMVWMVTPVARGTRRRSGPALDDEHPRAVAQRGDGGREPAGPAPTMRTSVVNMPPRSGRTAPRHVRSGYGLRRAHGECGFRAHVLQRRGPGPSFAGRS